MSEAWKPITIRQALVVTWASMGDQLRLQLMVQGLKDCPYVVLDLEEKVGPIAVPTVQGLREMLPCMKAERVLFKCAAYERRWWTPQEPVGPLPRGNHVEGGGVD